MLDASKVKRFINESLINLGITDRRGYVTHEGIRFFSEHYEIDEGNVVSAFFDERRCLLLISDGEIVDNERLKEFVRDSQRWAVYNYENVTEEQILNFCHIFDIEVRDDTTRWCILDDLQQSPIQEEYFRDVRGDMRSAYEEYMSELHRRRDEYTGRWSSERMTGVANTLASAIARQYEQDYSDRDEIGYDLVADHNRLDSSPEYLRDMASIPGMDIAAYSRSSGIRLSTEIRRLYTEDDVDPSMINPWSSENPWAEHEAMHEEDFIDWNAPEWTDLTI